MGESGRAYEGANALNGAADTALSPWSEARNDDPFDPAVLRVGFAGVDEGDRVAVEEGGDGEVGEERVKEVG